MTRCVCGHTRTNSRCTTTCDREMTHTPGAATGTLLNAPPASCEAVASQPFCSPPGAFRPLTILPGEISSQTIFEITLPPGGLEILLSLCGVTPVQTSFPVQQFKRNPTSCRSDSTGIMLFQARRQVVGQSDIQLFIEQRPEHVNVIFGH